MQPAYTLHLRGLPFALASAHIMPCLSSCLQLQLHPLEAWWSQMQPAGCETHVVTTHIFRRDFWSKQMCDLSLDKALEALEGWKQDSPKEPVRFS